MLLIGRCSNSFKDRNMRFSRFLLIFAVLGAATLAPRAVCADNQPWVWMLWPNEWQKMNDFKPYLKGETLSQRSLWDDDDWSPEAWIKDAGDAPHYARPLCRRDRHRPV